MTLLWIASVFVLRPLPGVLQADPYQDPDLLPCVWYTAERGNCSPHGKTVCPECSGQEACLCLARLQEKTGAIKGLLNNPRAKMVEGVVYIAEMPGKKFQLPQENPVMDQKNLVYVPHVLPVLAGSTVDFPNSDTVRHNVYSAPKSQKVFNLGQYAAGTVKQVCFEEEGLVSLLCNVHAEMSAYIVVCPTPYFAVTDRKEGSFWIRNVPPGTWKLTFFHEKLRSEQIEVTVEAGKETYVEFTHLQKK
ncbi:MAG: hypothetical protein HYU36_19330 [Planctomycetes bacterium]|nr:hypothetical protein [Planctomycetota bacterium]